VTTAATTLTRRRSAATIVGSIGAVGAAAAVAGLGTFGNFTDSTAPVGTAVDTGVVSIELSGAGDSGVVPFAGGLMLAGDSRTHLVDLVNDGTTALGSVTLESWATQSSVLDSDRVNGLQLSVESCSVTWVTSGLRLRRQRAVVLQRPDRRRRPGAGRCREPHVGRRRPPAPDRDAARHRDRGRLRGRHQRSELHVHRHPEGRLRALTRGAVAEPE
jgi:hypothetical protein